MLTSLAKRYTDLKHKMEQMQNMKVCFFLLSLSIDDCCWNAEPNKDAGKYYLVWSSLFVVNMKILKFKETITQQMKVLNKYDYSYYEISSLVWWVQKM